MGEWLHFCKRLDPAFLVFPGLVPPPRASVRDCSPFSTWFPFPLLLHHSCQKAVFLENNGVGSHRCPMCGWACHRHLFSALWPAVCLCLTCFPLHKETSQMRSESHINLWVWRYEFRKHLILCLFRKRIAVRFTLGSCEFPAPWVLRQIYNRHLFLFCFGLFFFL